VCPVDAEAVKYAALEMIDDANVSYALHTHIVDIQKTEHTIQHVIIYGKSGFGAYRAHQIIDATGDADVAALANAPFHKGSEEDGSTKPPTLMFRIGNVKHTKDRIRARWPKEAAEGTGGTECWLMALPRPGEYTVNSPSGLTGFDATSTEHLTHAQAKTTRQAFHTLDCLRQHVRGCEEAELLSIAPQLGLRDSRRIVGTYILSEDDVLTSRKFPSDGICNGVHPIDLHTGSAKFQGKELILTPCGDYYQIPYGCLIPQKLNNLLIAGRTISTTFLAQGSVRVMATCMGMGQAAGTAAALCVKQHISTDELNPKLLRETLTAQGAYLGHESEVPTWNQGKDPENPQVTTGENLNGK